LIKPFQQERSLRATNIYSEDNRSSKSKDLF
jgi:hypothetical protein